MKGETTRLEFRIDNAGPMSRALIGVSAPAAGEAHGAIFGEVRPACTMMAVGALVNPEFLVEIECEAVIPDDADVTTH